MLLTLGAAGATLLVMLAVLFIPALNACRDDARGLTGCLRGMVDDKFDLGIEPQATAAPEPAAKPTVAEAPLAAEPPAAVEVDVADIPLAKPAVEPSRSLAPQVAAKPAVPDVAPTPPQAITTPQVAAAPETPLAADPVIVPDEPVAEAPSEAAPAEVAPGAAPEETIALANVLEPAPVVIEPQAADAPSFVPPAAPIVEGAPPDLTSADALPVELPLVEEPAPSFVLPVTPDLPATPPPDLMVALAAPADAPAPELPDAPAPEAPIAADTAPGFVLPTTPDLPVSPPPDLTVAAVQPDPVITLPAPPDLPTSPPADMTIAAVEAPADLPVEPESEAPGFVLPTTPDLPASPPPDLSVAAVDPVVPAEPVPPSAPVLAPSIDAVEIEGDGNFIAGNGPAGATMRLYVDGIPVGVSPVEGGRWLVEGTGLLTEPSQTLKVEALDAITGKVLGEATIVFERPAEPVAETPPLPAVEPDDVIEPEATIDQTEVEAELPDATAEAPLVVEEPEKAVAPPPVVPEIAPVVPAGETPSVTVLKPVTPPDITTLTTGEPSDGAVVNLSALPKSPAIIAAFTLPAETPAHVTVLRAVRIGDPGAGRFVSGKAIIRRGDTLWDIAHRFYGRGIHYRTIFRANRELIARPGKIYPGQVFDLPLVYDD